MLYTHGVSWSYYVGPGTCVAPPCEKPEGIETAPVQNVLPGFRTVQVRTGARARSAPGTNPRPHG
jgi:hypothetical protein